jgi:predicted pyridoxine 5'-phosphate oxidase superfamily flavin-nucleotide-binding protein
MSELASLARCFQGVVPSVVATCDAAGEPNVTYVSQVYLVDERHVALSRQFFNKTTRNLEANPRACAEVLDPVTFQAYRLRLRFLRTETAGTLFDAMALRIQAIASHTGMSGVFRLIGADVFEVERLEPVAGFLDEPAGDPEGISAEGRRTELRGLQWVADRVGRATDLESLLEAVLEALESFFGFRHTAVLLAEESCGRLVTLASRGYGETGIGAEVAIGEGLLGTVARERRLLRIAGLQHELSYGRAIRQGAQRSGTAPAAAEVPLPGLPDAMSAMAIPLVVRDRLVGVIAAESRDPLAFDEWDEAYLSVIGNQIASTLAGMLERPAVEEEPAPPPAPPAPTPATGKKRSFTFYRSDDCVFADGEYLVRNVPGRILWRLLNDYVRDGRTDHSNRELRLDPSLGLPELRDNLESRLILLRRRLEERCPEVRLVSTGRGRFRLVVEAAVELTETP